MKTINLASVKPLKNSRFWLLGIAAGLIAIQQFNLLLAGEMETLTLGAPGPFFGLL